MSGRLTFRRSLVLAVIVQLSWFAGSFSAQAHQDTIFPISSSGKLLRIPEQYGPVILTMATEADPAAVSLQIGRRHIALPPCIVKLFDLPETERPRATGSWYHTRSTLPPYLNIELPRRTMESEYFSGYSLLFNLETAELISIHEHTASATESSMTQADVVPATICDSSEIQQLNPTLLESLHNKAMKSDVE